MQLSHSTSAAIAPAPPLLTVNRDAPTLIQLSTNTDTPPAAEGRKHIRKTSSWIEEPQPTTAITDSSQPTSARTQSETATSPRSLPPIIRSSRSGANSPQGERSAATDSHVIVLQPAPSIAHHLPSHSVSSAARPPYTRMRSTSAVSSVSPQGATSRSHTPSHHRRATSISPSACKLTLDELLADSRQYPLTLSEFRRYMVSQYTDEIVEFLLDVRRFKSEVLRVMDKEEKEKKAKRAGVVLAGESVEVEARRVYTEKDCILQRYLVAGSEREINVSCDMRTAIEQFNLQTHTCTTSTTASATATHTARPSPAVTCLVPLSALSALFDPAVREVCDLIEQGKFVQRFWHNQTRNIDRREIRVRYALAIVNLTLALAIALVCIFVSTVRWYRFIAWPFNFYGATTLVIARCGVCPTLTGMQKRIPDRDGKWDWWTVVRGRCDGDECNVADVELMKETERMANRVHMKALVLWSLLTALYVALPSHPRV